MIWTANKEEETVHRHLCTVVSLTVFLKVKHLQNKLTSISEVPDLTQGCTETTPGHFVSHLLTQRGMNSINSAMTVLQKDIIHNFVLTGHCYFFDLCKKQFVSSVVVSAFFISIFLKMLADSHFSHPPPPKELWNRFHVNRLRSHLVVM